MSYQHFFRNVDQDRQVLGFLKHHRGEMDGQKNPLYSSVNNQSITYIQKQLFSMKWSRNRDFL